MTCLESGALEEDDDLLIINNICYLVYKTQSFRRITAEDVFMFWYIQGQSYDYGRTEPEGSHTGIYIITKAQI